jgi:predicted CXXCH cytochrome family protein
VQLEPQPRRNWRVFIAGLCAAVAVAGGVLFFTSHRPSSPATAEHTSEYVNPAECATCHATIAATYRKTGMGRSFYRPTTSNVIEDYKSANKLNHVPSGMQYQMIEHDGTFFQRRNTIGFDGKEANVVEERVDYVIGSGNHARTYLHRTAQNQLIELPVSWYIERSGYWAMSPGFDNPMQKDIRGAITPECMFCHNGYPNFDSQAAVAKAEDGVFPARLPEGIDCQRCHGPGRQHVTLARANAPKDEIQHAIVNSKKLTREKQLDVCMECHLGTNETHTPPEIRNFTRTTFSYRPGEDLSEYKTLFEAPSDTEHQDFNIAHAAYRLRQSACFLKSEMTCTTCHNPHDIPRGERATSQYTAICQSCHTGVKHTVALPATETCITCHMPKRRPSGSVHVVMTDHYIQRYRPLKDLLAPIPEVEVPADKRRVNVYYPSKANENPRTALYLAIARVDDGDDDKGLVELQRVIEKQTPANPEPYLELGRAYARKAQNKEAVRWFEAALVKSPNNLAALRAIIPALLATGQQAHAIDLLHQALKQYPNDDLLEMDLGYAYLQTDKPIDARQALNAAIDANPERPEAYNLRGLVALRLGDTASAEKSFREAIRWQPTLAEAQYNLGFLLLSVHNLPESEFHLKMAIQANPNYAEAHHKLGLVYVLQNSLPSADSELREAAKLQPNSAEIHSDLGDLLASGGNTAQAAEEYRQVLRLRPDQADAQLSLGLALLQEHKDSEARRHLEQAAKSSDEAVAQEASNALQHWGR